MTRKLLNQEREFLLARIAQYERDFGTGKVSTGAFVAEMRDMVQEPPASPLVRVK